MGPVKLVFVVLLLLLGVSCVISKNTHYSYTECPSGEFDFIVIGAGAVGSIVASRLVDETNQRVLLLEGGAQGTGQRAVGGNDYVASDFIKDPITGEETLGEPWTRYDVPLMADTTRSASNVLKNMWNITAVGPFYTQAKVIGGNQATNGLGYNLPQNYDFDNWNIPGFSSTEMRVYLRRIENASEMGYPNRGTSGPINIKTTAFVPQEILRFAEAGILANYPEGGDFNSGTVTPGVYKGQHNVKDGIRESSAVSYLAKVLGKSNLIFVTSATVTRILFDNHNNATGVEYYNKHGQLKVANATKEVILCAGELQTVKILYNSGIGPASVLNAFGKPLIVVNEKIGQQIRNHQRSALSYSDTTLVNPNFYAYPAASLQYASSGTGVFDRGTRVISTQVDPTSPYPDININAAATSGSGPTNVYARSMTVNVVLTDNKYANGTCNLTSSDPLAPLLFRANTFVVDADVIKVAKGMLEARRIMSFWNGSLVETAPGPSYTNVTQLIPWIRANHATACHYYSSVPMGLDSSFPSDTRFRVRNVTRLRVVGPAVVPDQVFAGMQGLAMALAEKGTDMIKEDYGL